MMRHATEADMRRHAGDQDPGRQLLFLFMLLLMVLLVVVSSPVLDDAR